MPISKTQREAVYARDKGVCADCGRDTGEIQALLDQLEQADLDEGSKARAMKETRKRMKEMGFTRKHLWEADHIRAEAHGGSDDLDNLQTLCIPCHKKKTGRQKGEDAKRERIQWKAKPTPEPVKAEKRKLKTPNVRMPGVNSPAWSVMDREEELPEVVDCMTWN